MRDLLNNIQLIEESTLSQFRELDDLSDDLFVHLLITIPKSVISKEVVLAFKNEITKALLLAIKFSPCAENNFTQISNAQVVVDDLIAANITWPELEIIINSLKNSH